MKNDFRNRPNDVPVYLAPNFYIPNRTKRLWRTVHRQLSPENCLRENCIPRTESRDNCLPENCLPKIVSWGKLYPRKLTPGFIDRKTVSQTIVSWAFVSQKKNIQYALKCFDPVQVQWEIVKKKTYLTQPNLAWPTVFLSLTLAFCLGFLVLSHMSK